MKQHRLAAAVALVGLVLAGCDSQTSEVELKSPAQKASYGIGLNMGRSLSEEGMDDLDSKAVAQGIEDALAKKEPRIKDEDMVEAFSFLQNRAEERMTALNKEAAEAGKKFLEENGKREGVVTTASGLQYMVLRQGNGPRAKPGQKVRVNYEGKLLDGTVFDSSVARGEPIEFGLNQVIKGWTEGVQLMVEGEKTRFYIPANLAYGDRAAGKIPPGSVLIFDVELLGIQ